jgi:hypothetical protein
MSLRSGSLTHQLLSVTSAAPRPLKQLAGVLEARGATVDIKELNKNVAVLRRNQYVHIEGGRGTKGNPYLFTLSPAGEEELDRLAGCGA